MSPRTAETWRAGDLRGDEGPPRSVAGVVRHALSALVATRIAEAALLGAAAACVVLAAAAWSGAELARLDAWAAAAAGAALTGASWWLEHRTSAAEVARTLDRELRHQGALVTAFELERRRERGPLASLCVARVLARLRRRDALRAVRPPLALPVVAPLIGAAVLAAALDLARAEPEARPIGEVSGALADGLLAASQGVLGAEDADPALARELRGIAVDARALDLVAEGHRPGGPEEARRRIEELDQRVARLDRDAAASPELKRELGRARGWLDVLREELAASEAAPAEAAEAGEGGAGVTGGAGDGTMSGSTPPAGGGEPAAAAPAERAPAPAGGAVETGAAAGAWWPAEHDELVRRWLERVRRADR